MQQSEEIVALGAAELARRISDGQLSAVEVTERYIGCLLALHERCNVITCERFDGARQEARQADERRARGDWLGPLHGVPITVKDCFHVTGLPTALGVDGRNAIAGSDALLVRRLRRAGAILLAKTNVSQGMATMETTNPRHGRTVHPTDPSRSPAGSSGGEAVAVAAGGSALGLGSDLAGSIRLPASFCGAYALKPTGRLLETSGMAQVFPFSLPIPTCPGPLARCVEDLAVALSILQADGEPALWMPLGHHDLLTDERRSIRFAVWTENAYFPTHPVIQHAVHAAANTLTQLGLTRVELPPTDFRQVIMLQVGIMLADGGELLRDFVGSGIRDPLIHETLRLAGLPSLIRQLTVGIARARGRDHFADIVQCAGKKTVAEYWKLISAIEQFRAEFQQTWLERQVDILLMPVFPLPALPHGAARDAVPACGFVFLPNLIDLPAGVVPVGMFPSANRLTHAANPWQAPEWARHAMQGAEGLPLAIQVVGSQHSEALVLRVMRAIEAHAEWLAARMAVPG